MQMHLKLIHVIPDFFYHFYTEIDGDEWNSADELQRETIISNAMTEMAMKLLEEKKIRLERVYIDGEEYLEED